MTVTRGRILDSYEEDGEMVVLLPQGRVLALSPLAAHVVRCLAERPHEAAELPARLVAEFGEPPHDPGAAAATRDLLEEMSDLGLVEKNCGPMQA